MLSNVKRDFYNKKKMVYGRFSKSLKMRHQKKVYIESQNVIKKRFLIFEFEDLCRPLSTGVELTNLRTYETYKNFK